MKESKPDQTKIILTTIISLITIIGVVGTYISNISALQVELVNIKTEIVKVNDKLDARDNEIRALTERVIKLEQK